MDPYQEVATDSSMNVQDSDGSDSSAPCCPGTGPAHVASFNCGEGCGNGSVGEAMAGANPRGHKRRAPPPPSRCRAKRPSRHPGGAQDMDLDQQVRSQP